MIPADSPGSSGSAPVPAGASDRGLRGGADEAAARLRRIHWRARRGLLENDIVLERFFAATGDALSEEQVRALDQLLDLTDPELLDLILARREPEGELADPAVVALLAQLRSV